MQPGRPAVAIPIAAPRISLPSLVCLPRRASPPAPTSPAALTMPTLTASSFTRAGRCRGGWRLGRRAGTRRLRLHATQSQPILAASVWTVQPALLLHHALPPHARPTQQSPSNTTNQTDTTKQARLTKTDSSSPARCPSLPPQVRRHLQALQGRAGLLLLPHPLRRQAGADGILHGGRCRLPLPRPHMAAGGAP